MLNLLNKVMQPCTIYRGVIITSSANKHYKALNKTYATIQLAKDAVDMCYSIIENSIKK